MTQINIAVPESLSTQKAELETVLAGIVVFADGVDRVDYYARGFIAPRGTCQ